MRIDSKIYFCVYSVIHSLLYYTKIILNPAHHEIKVKSIDDTIDEMRYKSCIRFGDGEMQMIIGNGICYQSYYPELSRRLGDILTSDANNNLLICIPDVFGKLDNWNSYARYIWSGYRYHSYNTWQKLTKPTVYYGNAHATRPYVDLPKSLKKNADLFYTKLRGIWYDKDVVIVEGVNTRNGVGNNLFSCTKSIERIICPSRNAFCKYTDIFSTVINLVRKDKLILISLGPTGKILAYDLFNIGYHVIDIGHIDNDYEWYIHAVMHPINLNNNKHFSEESDKSITYCIDEAYHNQIIAIIE